MLTDVAVSDTTALELSIIMPCLNEADTLERCIVKAKRFLQSSEIAGEIVIADNGSTDGSQVIARRCGARVVNVKLRGYGAALGCASLAAQGKYIIMGDSDDSYDFVNLMPFVEQLRNGYDLVMGNRFLGGIKTGAMPWKNRYIGNPILTTIGRILFRCPAKDFHCGLRGFSHDAFIRMDLRTTGMEFASEMVIKSTLLGLKIAEVPTTLSPDGRSRPPHLRPWRDGWRHLRFMLLFSPRWLFLYPGLLLMAIGLLTGLWIWPHPRQIGSVVFDVHTMLFSAAAALIGYQAVIFACLSKIFVINEGLLPADPKLNRLFSVLTLERGVMLGMLIVLLGLFGAIWALANWSNRSFGTLDPQRTLRYVIPSVFALVIGSQTILFSLFSSVLGLHLRKSEPPKAP
ncbi:MAG: glycosyltransferase family 2 protein [Planctomycetes bacterium]|nr:glycosyltransferase family 2 protein [Planctomycetota bacterium]